MAQQTAGWKADDTIKDPAPQLRGCRRRGPRTRPAYRVRFNLTSVTVRPKIVRFFGPVWKKVKSCLKKRNPPVDVRTLYSNPNFETSDSGSSMDLDIKPRISCIRSLVRERMFAWAIGNLNFKIKKVKAGSSSFFRAVADQIYRDADLHDIVRQQCMDHIEANRSYYAPFIEIEEDFSFYVQRMRLDFAYPSNLEMQAVAELYQRTLIIYFYNIRYKMWVPRSPIVHVNYFSSIFRSDPVSIEICYESKLRPISAIEISFHNDNCFKSLRKTTRTRMCQTQYVHRQVLENLDSCVERYIPDGAISHTTLKEIKTRKWKRERKPFLKPLLKRVREQVYRQVLKRLPKRLRRQVLRQVLKRKRKKTVVKVLPKNRRYTIHRLPHCVDPGPKSSKKWMSLGVEAQRRHLEDAFTGRLPYYYTSPYFKVPRKMSKATITTPSMTGWSSIRPFVAHIPYLNPKGLVKKESLRSVITIKDEDDMSVTSEDWDGESDTTEDWDQPSTSRGRRIVKYKEDPFSRISWDEPDPNKYDSSSDDLD